MQYYCDVVSKKNINNRGFFFTEGTIDADGNITLNEQYAFSTGAINMEKQQYNYSGYYDPWYYGYDDIKVWKIRGATDGVFSTPKSTILGKKSRELRRQRTLGHIHAMLPLKEMARELASHFPRKHPQGNTPMFPPEGEVALIFLT